MKTRRPSESAIFTLRVTIACALLCAASLLAYLSVAAPSASNDNDTTWRAKVDPRVYAAASAGQTEFMIYMADQVDLSGAAALTKKAEKGAFVYQQLTTFAETNQAPVRALLSELGAEYQPFWISNAIWARGDTTVIQTVANHPAVGAIQPVGRGALNLPPQEDAAEVAEDSIPAAPNAPQAVVPGLVRVNADDVWALGYRGHGAVVAGQDTGVRFTHEALRKQYRGWGGSAAASNHDYNWHDAIHLPNFADPTNPCNPGGAAGAGQPSTQPCDDNSHGSHTVGTMVGDNGGTEQIGMAPEAKWIACRNMGGGVGIIPTYLECMQWMIAPTKVNGTNPDASKAPDVINNSWGCVEACPAEPNNPLRDAMQASRAAGIVYVASAGNDGPACGTIQHAPARYPEAFTVGNTTHTTDVIGTGPQSSSRGPTAVDPENPSSPIYIKPNISAPGTAIRSSNHGTDNAYGNKTGTSMAGPHVAGLVALIISANPALAGNVNRIEDIIEQTAVKKTTGEMCGVPPDTNTQVPNNTYGWGRIDALAAVNRALAEATPVPLVSVASRKSHGTPGTNFDLVLSFTDPAVVEPRVGQAQAGEHTIVFKFVNAVANVGGAAVTSGTGSVSSSSVGADPKEYIVNLTGVSDALTLGLTLSAVTDAEGNSTPAITVPIGFLLGDSNADRTVNSGDAQQTRNRSGQQTEEANFRSDVNLDGAINSGDAFIVRRQSGSAIPQ